MSYTELESVEVDVAAYERVLGEGLWNIKKLWVVDEDKGVWKYLVSFMVLAKDEFDAVAATGELAPRILRQLKDAAALSSKPRAETGAKATPINSPPREVTHNG